MKELCLKISKEYKIYNTVLNLNLKFLILFLLILSSSISTYVFIINPNNTIYIFLASQILIIIFICFETLFGIVNLKRSILEKILPPLTNTDFDRYLRKEYRHSEIKNFISFNEFLYGYLLIGNKENGLTPLVSGREIIESIQYLKKNPLEKERIVLENFV